MRDTLCVVSESELEVAAVRVQVPLTRGLCGHPRRGRTDEDRQRAVSAGRAAEQCSGRAGVAGAVGAGCGSRLWEQVIVAITIDGSL